MQIAPENWIDSSLEKQSLEKNNLWQKSNLWRHHLMIVRKDRNHEHGSCYCFGRFCSPFSPFPRRVAQVGRVLRAANYLSVGQIYLYANPLLREPLKLEHIKPRLLGHWGTTPGLNYIYVHFNRLIKKYDLNVIYVTGPGHGGPGMVANTYLEGTYSELYSNIPQTDEGMRKL